MEAPTAVRHRHESCSWTAPWRVAHSRAAVSFSCNLQLTCTAVWTRKCCNAYENNLSQQGTPSPLITLRKPVAVSSSPLQCYAVDGCRPKQRASMRYIESRKSRVCERNLVPTLEIRTPNDSSTVSPGAEGLQFRQEVWRVRGFFPRKSVAVIASVSKFKAAKSS